MSKEKFAFDKTNFILLGIGMAVVIIGSYSDFCSLIQKVQCGSPVRLLCHNILFLRSSYEF